MVQSKRWLRSLGTSKMEQGIGTAPAPQNAMRRAQFLSPIGKALKFLDFRKRIVWVAAQGMSFGQ